MKYLICNLKSHKTYDEMLEYKEQITKLNSKDYDIILSPSIPYLPLFKDTNTLLCSQDISLNNALFLTGDLNIQALKSLNVKYILIGHYERRKYYHETLETIINKISLALANNFKVIYCIGETETDIKNNTTYDTLFNDITKVFNSIKRVDYQNIIIAYEPSYLINNNIPYDIPRIAENTKVIKDILSIYDKSITLVFGGNIKKENVNEIKTIPTINGYILGNSSLDINEIMSIIN